MKLDYEVLIIGGGPAGLSTAMTLGRLSRTALIADDNRPRNAPSSHLNNFPTRDGIHPKEWLELARRDLKKYQTIKTYEGSVLSVDQLPNGFRAKLSSGAEIHIKKLVLAYGVKDKMPEIPGFKELWGKSIFHCPFCHGYEIRGSKLGLLISHEMSFHSLPMIHSLASELIFFTNNNLKLTLEQKRLLERKEIPLFEERLRRLLHEGESLRGIELEDGQKIDLPYLFFQGNLPFELKSTIGEQLGCKKNQFGFYEINEMGSTSTPNVFAAGDNMAMAHSVLLAAASGVKAGAGVIAELLQEER